MDVTSPSRRAEHIGLLGALFANMALTLHLFRDVLRDPAHVVAGASNTEVWTFLWGHFVMEDSLRRRGVFPYHLDISDFPSEGVLWLKDPFWTFVMTPLQSFFSVPLLYNFESMAQFVLAGLGFYLLCRVLNLGMVAAIAASLSFAFMPHNLGEIYNGNQEALAVCWLPLWLWAMFALIRHPGVVRATTAAGLLFLLLINNQYFGLAMAMASVPLGLVGIWYWGREGGWFKRGLWLLGAVALGVALFWPSYAMIKDSIEAPGAITILDQTIGYELPFISDLRHFWAPLAPLQGIQGKGPPFQDIIYPGFALVGAGILGTFLGRGPWRWFWLPLAVLFMSFSLGPVLSINGELIRGDGGGYLRMPWGVIAHLDPRVGMVTLPHRFAVPAGLFLSLGLASLLDGLIHRWTPRFRVPRMALAAFLGLAVVGEMLTFPPYKVPLLSLNLPRRAYASVLREFEAPGAVLGLPITNGENELREYLWHQVLHKRPVDASLRKEVMPLISQRVPLLRRIMAAQGNFEDGRVGQQPLPSPGATETLPFMPDPDGASKMLGQGYGFVALHMDHACHVFFHELEQGRTMVHWDKALSNSFGPGLMVGDETVVYVMDPGAREGFRDKAIAVLGENQVQPSADWFAHGSDPCLAILDH